MSILVAVFTGQEYEASWSDGLHALFFIMASFLGAYSYFLVIYHGR
jgi:hypothetical protein